MKERIFPVDGNWFLHRAFHTLHTNRPIEEALPFHLLSMVCKSALRVRANYLCVAFDGPKVFRYKVYEGYKEGRKGPVVENTDAENAPVTGDVYDFLPQIYNLFHELGILFFQPRTREADDVLASVVYKYASKYLIDCGTCDKDGYQYLQPGVRLFDPSFKDKTGKTVGRYITQEMAEERKGVACSQMVDYQTLIGDKGDSIPAIKGIGPARAKSILDEHGNLNNWFKNSTGDERAFIQAQKENLRRNRKLVQLVTDCAPPNELHEWKIHKVKPKLNLPSSYYDYHAFVYPKTKGLFG